VLGGAAELPSCAGEALKEACVAGGGKCVTSDTPFHVAVALTPVIGRAVQAEPMKPKLKPRRTDGLKLKYDKSVLNSASNLISNSTCAATHRVPVAERRAPPHGCAADRGVSQMEDSVE